MKGEFSNLSPPVLLLELVDLLLLAQLILADLLALLPHLLDELHLGHLHALDLLGQLLHLLFVLMIQLGQSEDNFFFTKITAKPGLVLLVIAKAALFGWSLKKQAAPVPAPAQ